VNDPRPAAHQPARELVLNERDLGPEAARVERLALEVAV
jgi:hypothetical protein